MLFCICPYLGGGGPFSEIATVSPGDPILKTLPHLNFSESWIIPLGFRTTTSSLCNTAACNHRRQPRSSASPLAGDVGSGRVGRVLFASRPMSCLASQVAIEPPDSSFSRTEKSHRRV